MTTNPTRPATGGVIATTWGLSVADTVVRRYPNAAARDADLTGHTAADLTGQVVVLTGTGEVLQYAGPLMGWRKPWNMPWGSVIYGEALNGVTGDGSVRDLVVLTPAAPHPAGRLVRMTSTLFAWANTPGLVMGQYHRVTGINKRTWHVLRNAATSDLALTAYHATTTFALTAPAATFMASAQIVSGSATGNPGGDPHTLLVEDVGPAVNPTALVTGADGEVTVDLELVDDEYRHLWTPGE